MKYQSTLITFRNFICTNKLINGAGAGLVVSCLRHADLIKINDVTTHSGVTLL